jgi:hypothetical protein
MKPAASTNCRKGCAIHEDGLHGVSVAAADEEYSAGLIIVMREGYSAAAQIFGARNQAQKGCA